MARRKREFLFHGSSFQSGPETIEIERVPNREHTGYDPERARMVVYRISPRHMGRYVSDIREGEIRFVEKWCDQLFNKLVTIDVTREAEA